ncbi:MAG TPA: DUF2057 family protein [Alcanivoracaceae bacterium]|nr:DUF2057 family protein [Alcanivoracaceae bacterium]
MFRIILASFIALLLSACATTPEVQHLYDGPQKPASQLLTLTIPTQIEVLSINEQALAGSASQFLGGAKQTLLLNPGEYTVTGYYKELWLDNTDNHYMVRSQPVDFLVKGQAGEKVAIDYEHPTHTEGAKALAKDFQGWAINLNTNVKTPSQSSTQKRPNIFASNNAPAAPAPAKSIEPIASSEDNTQLLPLMKAYWREATAAEKREFLQWISE